MGFFDDVQDFLGVKKKAPEISEGQVNSAAEQDTEVIRAKEDLKTANDQYDKRQAEFKQAQNDAVQKQMDDYMKQKTAADAAVQKAKAAFDQAKQGKDDGKASQAQKALQDADAAKIKLDDQGRWKQDNPVDKYIPEHYKKDLADAQKSIRDMQQKVYQATQAAKGRARQQLQAQAAAQAG